MTAKVILNPYAGRWKGQREKERMQAALQAAGLEFDLAISEKPAGGVALAEQAVREGFSPVIAAGGDGSIGDVLNGMLRAKPEGILGPFGVLPLGTANDLVVNLGHPLELEEAARCIAAGNTRRIDLGSVNGWVFANNSAIGLEPVVTIYNIRMTWLRGVIRYLVAALRAINEKPTWQMDLAWDDGQSQGPCSLISVGNCPVTGGVFRMAPGADPGDGLLTFVYGYAKNRRKMLSLLPKTMSGEHVNDPVISQHHTRRLSIQTHPPSPLQVDGELRSEAETNFVYECLPARLDILAPLSG